MNDEDIGTLCSDSLLKSRIMSSTKWDLEVLSLLALKMNAIGMSPSDWYKMITNG